jgi:hypothetical protein
MVVVRCSIDAPEGSALGVFVCGHCVTSRIKNELAVVTYRLVKEHQAFGLKGLVFALDTGGHIDVSSASYCLQMINQLLLIPCKNWLSKLSN